jgi:hypothetical protein
MPRVFLLPRQSCLVEPVASMEASNSLLHHLLSLSKNSQPPHLLPNKKSLLRVLQHRSRSQYSLPMTRMLRTKKFPQLPARQQLVSNLTAAKTTF